MLSIEECRKTLGKKWEWLSDEQVIEIRDALYELGNIIFDDWILEKRKRKPVKLEKSKLVD